jgi:hypothetical protein
MILIDFATQALREENIRYAQVYALKDMYILNAHGIHVAESIKSEITQLNEQPARQIRIKVQSPPPGINEPTTQRVAGCCLTNSTNDRTIQRQVNNLKF